MQIEKYVSHREKKIRVVLELPTQTNEKAKDEFVDKLKEIYLNKVRIGTE